MKCQCEEQVFRTSLNDRVAVGMMCDTVVDLTGGLQREDLADLELAKKKQNVLLKQLLAMPGRDPMLGLERRSSEVRSVHL